MKLSGSADRIFLALIAVTAVLKILSSRPETPPSNRAVIAPLTAALSESGLTVRVLPSPAGAIVFATAKSCRLWARDYLPYGTALAYYRSRATGYGPLAFVYQGRVYDRPPKVGPLLSFFLGRELARLGLDASRAPIIAVAASPGCALSAVPWDRVGEVAW